MSAPAGLRALMATYGLKMVRQKIGDRSRVWLLGVMLTDGEDLNYAVSGEADHIDQALAHYTRRLQGKTIVIEREFPDTCTVTLAGNFGEDAQGNITGLIPFEEMYDINNPPPAAAIESKKPLWLGRPMIDSQTAGPLDLYRDERRGYWFVRVGGFDAGGHIVAVGDASQIDAKTREWLGQFVPLLRELDMVQEAM